MAYKKAEDPAYDQYDCDQIKDASHDVRILVSLPNNCKTVPSPAVLAQTDSPLSFHRIISTVIRRHYVGL
jgi:hypothetical protein